VVEKFAAEREEIGARGGSADLVKKRNRLQIADCGVGSE
jgi:hypothetical protein